MTNCAAVSRANTANRSWSSRTSTVIQRRYARRIRCAENAAARSRPSVSEGETYSLGMDVHLLWHVRHAKNLDGSDVHHRDSSGDGLIDGDFDDVKIVGVYSFRAVPRQMPSTEPGLDLGLPMNRTASSTATRLTRPTGLMAPSPLRAAAAHRAGGRRHAPQRGRGTSGAVTLPSTRGRHATGAQNRSPRLGGRALPVGNLRQNRLPRASRPELRTPVRR